MQQCRLQELRSVIITMPEQVHVSCTCYSYQLLIYNQVEHTVFHSIHPNCLFLVNPTETARAIRCSIPNFRNQNCTINCCDMRLVAHQMMLILRYMHALDQKCLCGHMPSDAQHVAFSGTLHCIAPGFLHIFQYSPNFGLYTTKHFKTQV